MKLRDYINLKEVMENVSLSQEENEALINEIFCKGKKINFRRNVQLKVVAPLIIILFISFIAFNTSNIAKFFSVIFGNKNIEIIEDKILTNYTQEDKYVKVTINEAVTDEYLGRIYITINPLNGYNLKTLLKDNDDIIEIAPGVYNEYWQLELYNGDKKVNVETIMTKNENKDEVIQIMTFKRCDIDNLNMVLKPRDIQESVSKLEVNFKLDSIVGHNIMKDSVLKLNMYEYLSTISEFDFSNYEKYNIVEPTLQNSNIEIRNLVISPISLKLEMISNIDTYNLLLDLNIHLKNKDVIKVSDVLENYNADSNMPECQIINKENNKKYIIWKFKEIIDYDSIDYIELNGHKISCSDAK